MNQLPYSTDELQALADMVCNNAMTDDGMARLEQMLLDNADAQDFYLGRVAFDAWLQWEIADQVEETTPVISLVPTPSSPPAALPVATGFFSSDWPVAYLMATVICGIGIAVAAFTYVSRPDGVAPAITAVEKIDQRGEPRPECVGRITAMFDCKWVNQRKSPASGRVAVGQDYALASGLMEITYHTGARVVLQGPATYNVESRNGGFLTLGKMTGKVENPAAKGFVVRTPTATITDIGTEFGVEVDAHGVTTSHVFRGSIEVERVTCGDNDKRIRLAKDESIVVERQPGVADPVFVHRKVDPGVFVRADQLAHSGRETTLSIRRRWLLYSNQLRNDPSLVAYYTFEKSGTTNAVLPNLSPAGHALDGNIVGAEWVLGRLPDKYALMFHGPNSGDKVVLPEQDWFNFKGPFSVAVWFKVAQFDGKHMALITKGDAVWRLQQAQDQQQLTFATNDGPTSDNGSYGRIEVQDCQWHLGVAVYEPRGNVAEKRLYVDGRLDVTDQSPAPLHQTHDPVWIGSNSGCPERTFHGWIDEVAIFDRALSADEIQKMFQAGSPRGTERKGNVNE